MLLNLPKLFIVINNDASNPLSHSRVTKMKRKHRCLCSSWGYKSWPGRHEQAHQRRSRKLNLFCWFMLRRYPLRCSWIWWVTVSFSGPEISGTNLTGPKLSATVARCLCGFNVDQQLLQMLSGKWKVSEGGNLFVFYNNIRVNTWSRSVISAMVRMKLELQHRELLLS